MELRPYQSECVESVFRAFAEHRSTLAVLATGLGKTVIGSAVIRDWFHRGMPGRVLWLAHREELIDQAAQAIRTFAGVKVAVEMGDARADEYGFDPSHVVIASVQTLVRERRRRRFEPRKFGLIITDEAHHAAAKSYCTVYDYFRKGENLSDLLRIGNPVIRHLGITATPRRADNLAMGKVFDSVAYDYGIEPAVADGWLVPVRQAIAVVDALDLSRVSVHGGDYSAGQLDAILSDEHTQICLKMCRPILDHTADGESTIVFCAGKNQSRKMAETLNDAKPGSAAFVTDETPKDERRKIIADFRSGRIQYFCNCGIATEGFDAAAVAWVIMARPTKSLPLYVQMLGRATRPLPGTVEGHSDAANRKAAVAHSRKPYATVLDFVGNAHIHGASATVSAADVLGGRYDDETKRYAKIKLQCLDGPKAIDEVLDRSEAELALLREEEDRRARIVADVDYRVRFLDSTDSGPRREFDAGQRVEMATERQVWKLVSLGVRRHTAEGMTKRQAMGAIGRLLEKQGGGR